jgi:hypothetical protein
VSAWSSQLRLPRFAAYRAKIKCSMTLFVRPRVLSTLKFAECVLAIVEQKFVVQ